MRYREKEIKVQDVPSKELENIIFKEFLIDID
jgi:hypothetical protein